MPTPQAIGDFEVLGFRKRGFSVTAAPSPWEGALNPLAPTVFGDGEQTISVVLTANRISGPAPLSVRFDAWDTTHSDGSIIFARDIGFAFDFDDVSAGTWTYSGEDKNFQRGGPLAVHVFEAPGTYTVKCRARDPNGDIGQAQIEITVTDPDTVYSGTSTVCISRTSDHTGAPSGATQLSNQTSWPTWQSNTRYLLHAGQDFSSFGTISMGLTIRNVQVGPYGTGADPIHGSVNLSGNGDGVTTPNNITFYDVVGGDGTTFSTRHHCNVTILRGRFTGTTSTRPIGVGSDLSPGVINGTSEPTRSTLTWPKDIHFIESELYATEGVTQTNVSWSYARSLCFVGCDIRSELEHGLRSPHAAHSLYSHNRFAFAHSDTNRHYVKMHASGTAEVDNDNCYPDPARISTKSVVSYNLCGTVSDGDYPNWGIAIAPQNSTSDERVRDVIVEANMFYSNLIAEVAEGGNTIVGRGNVVLPSTAANYSTNAQGGALPAEYRGPYYNTTPMITTEDPV